jgi:hypothetical protein
MLTYLLSRFTTVGKGLSALLASCVIRPSDLPLKSVSALKLSPFYPPRPRIFIDPEFDKTNLGAIQMIADTLGRRVTK